MKARLYIPFFFTYILSLPGWAQVPAFQPVDIGISEVTDIGNFYGHGASAADFDNDGDIDFYLCTMSGMNDRLYQNNGNGEFTDVANSLGIVNRQSARMALWLDYNADSRLDLVLLVERCANFKCGQPILIFLYQQQPDGSFVEKTTEAGLAFGDKYDNLETYSVGGMAAGDINNDGYLDLLVTIWGAQMTVFLNNGNETFTDISTSSGLGLSSHYYWQPMFHDFDHDGRSDIMSNVDFGPNQFWKNNGDNKFSEIARQIGSAVDNSEMGLTLGDIDNDGDLDAYATNITRMFQGAQEHNVLLRNDSEFGFLVFNEVAESYGVAYSGWDWGTTFFDMNNDGWVDLASTNGWNNDPEWGPDQSHLWMNVNGTFSDVSAQSGFNDLLSATSLIAFDKDRDGDLDLLQTLKDNPNTKMPAIMYENALENLHSENNFLVVRPRMSGPNHFAIGAIVKVRAGELSMMRLISAGTSFFGQEPAEAFFGIGKENMAEEVIIEWPDGTSTIFEDVLSGQVITLENEQLPAPTLLNVVYNGDGYLIEWTDNTEDESGFIIERSESPSFDTFTEIAVPAGETSYFDPVVDINRVWYRIKAKRGLVSSTYSEVKSGSAVTSSEHQNNMFRIYPNPAFGRFTVSLRADWSGLSVIQIIDQAGRVIFNSIIQTAGSQQEIPVDINLVSGIYYVRVIHNKRSLQQKLVIYR